MLNLSTHRFQSFKPLLNHLERPITALALTLGLAAAALSPAQGTEAPQVSSTQVARANMGMQVVSQRLPNGVYLYGQSPEAEQIGSAYMVFEVNDQQVMGAFYMPSSSFDCFYGEVQAQQLALNVVDAYEQTVHPYAVALETTGSVATNGNEAIAPLSLEGFHPISSVSDNDQRILSVCKVNRQPVN